MVGCLGVISFILFYLDDLNLIFFRIKLFKNNFIYGAVLFIISTILNIYLNIESFSSFFYLVLAIFSLFLLIYALFFSLDSDAYKGKACHQNCISTGFYAMCRHPGVIFMFFMYLFLYLAMPCTSMLFMLVWYNILNLGYVILQDWIIFPKQFDNYQEYRGGVPFLLPNIKSIKQCFVTFRRRSNEI